MAASKSPRKADPLRAKRQRLADLVNRTKDVPFYTADSHDIASMPEPVLDKNIGYYEGFACQHVW